MEAEKVGAVLGGRKVIGRKVGSALDLVRAVRAGFPYRVIEHVIETGVLTRPELEHDEVTQSAPLELPRRRQAGNPAANDRDVHPAAIARYDTRHAVAQRMANPHEIVGESTRDRTRRFSR